MSGLVNKAKEVLSGNKSHDTSTGHHTTSTHGHSGATTHDATTHGTHTGTHTGTLTTGEYGHNTSSGTAGPHSSNIANKLDPRVDSDADHRNNPTSGVGGGYGQTHANTGYGQTHGTAGYGQTHGTAGHSQTGSGYGHNTSTATTGPHSSNVANKLDPRVDSDVDHRNNPTSGVSGGYGQSHGSAGYIPTSTSGGKTTAGPHSSNLANKLDPRVDSDADHRNNPAGGVGGYGSNQGGYGRPL